MTIPSGSVCILRWFVLSTSRILRTNERFLAEAFLSITFYSHEASVEVNAGWPN